MQCFEMLERPPSTDTLTLTDAQEEVEQMLSAYLLNGFCLLEKACPACNVPLVKRPVTNMIESPRFISIQGIDTAFPPLAGIAYCVKCHAHVVANTAEFQLVQGHNSSHKTGSIYFLSESATMTDSMEGETTSKETGTLESTVVTRSAGSASSSSSNDYDDSLMSASYQIEEIEVVLAKTEDGDVDDDDEIVEEEIQHQCVANDYPSPPPTQRMSNVDPINSKETKIEADVATTPRQYVELTLHEHENLLQQYRQNVGNPRHDPSMRVVDLEEIELKGCGEDVSLLAIDDNVLENRFFREIERTNSHETAVDLAIQQSTSRMRMNKVTPVLLDFPMPEFNVRREVAIKVLAGKMVQGYSIMDGQCDACLMPLMCDAKGTVVSCFVCRSIRKSYYKSLATQAVENRCLKTSSDLLRQKRLELQQVVTLEAQDQIHVNGATANANEANVIVSQNDDKLVNHNPTVSTYSYGRDDTVTDSSDVLPENQVNMESTRDVVTEPIIDATMPHLTQLDNSSAPDTPPFVEVASIQSEPKEIMNDNVDIVPLDGPSDGIIHATQDEEIMIGNAADDKDNNELVENEGHAQACVLENGESNEASVAVSQCDSSIDVVRNEIGNRIQNGWTLLDKTCPECTLPLMTDEIFMHEICIQCEMMTVTVNDDDANVAELINPCIAESFPKEFIETDIASSLNEDSKFETLGEIDASYVQQHDSDGITDPNLINAAVEPEYGHSELKPTESYVSEIPLSVHMSVGGDTTEPATPINEEYSKIGEHVILMDTEQPTIAAIESTDSATNLHQPVGEEPTEHAEECFDVKDTHNLYNDDAIEPVIVYDVSNQANNLHAMENAPNVLSDNEIEPFIEDYITDTTEIVDVVEDMECISNVKATESVIDRFKIDEAKNACAATTTEAIDAEKVFLEISESKSHDQPSIPAIVGPFHWITSKTSVSSAEKSIKPLDPPASNDPVITDIFSRNCRRLGPPVGSRFRSNKSPEGFHRVDVRSCSPVRTLSPEILPIKSNDDTDALPDQTCKETETSTAVNLDNPRVAKGWGGDEQKGIDDSRQSDDAIILNASPSIEINGNFVRLEVPKTLSYNDRDAIVRLIEVATRTDGAQTKNDLTDRVGRRTESPGNSVANMPHSLSSARSYTNSAKSISTHSHVSHMSNSNNPPSPERHSVIDCTSPSNNIPKRAPSPGISEAPNHRTVSDTSSVYSNVSSRASRSSRPSSEHSASTGHRSERSSQHSRRRATPETTIRPKKPGLPSYIPGNPSRPHVSGSRSYQQSFPSESTAFSRTNSKIQLYNTSNQSTGSVKSMPLSNKTTAHHHVNHHIKQSLPSSSSWRERRDEVILIDDTVADERDCDVIDGDKLEALLARIESTKSQLENADDVISQYRMRDLIVNLTRSAELLQKIEES